MLNLALLAKKKHKNPACDEHLADAERFQHPKTDLIRAYVLAKDRKFTELDEFLVNKKTADAVLILA